MADSVIKKYKSEFPISRSIRKILPWKTKSFYYQGNVFNPDLRNLENIIADMRKNDSTHLTMGELVAFGTLEDIFHHVFSTYVRNTVPDFYHHVVDDLTSELSQSEWVSLYKHLSQVFPENDDPLSEKEINALSKGDRKFTKLLTGFVEDLILTRLANLNPASYKLKKYISDNTLIDSSPYLKSYQIIYDSLARLPAFDPDLPHLIDFLHSPVAAEPDSLEKQLEYVRTNWGDILSNYTGPLLLSLDMLAEENKFRGGGPGTPAILTYDDLDTIGFSPDHDWMPELVLMAKNIFVWLYQLSENYNRNITTLDQIPDEEIDKLADYGFTGLWLIGIWERSPASKIIKQRCGNPDAEASAYSLKSYTISESLGGEYSLNILKEKCRLRGIRLACDMVPNHTGIDSDWLINHPDYYISSTYPPYPSYSFTGENLSNDERVRIFLEDHYYNQSDAAVVFKIFNVKTNTDHFIYHGNDGTSMPWNDTAQLNYLNLELREKIIQIIISVAKNFPVIRFDAAMTLAKKHFQRLWFPKPGTGGDIPSRSQYALSESEFSKFFPTEFWREVVDRVAVEAPDTLLLAEAFWMMEGYFVRNLGMHRVYNSAFMNMIRNEDNASYHTLLNNTLEYDPEILKRFVNFLNNPDEEPAIEQFGAGDKYFCATLMMITMPGLPMFGHGQIEGYHEKYGMEYHRPYFDEIADVGFIKHHKNIIFPVLKRRSIFAHVTHFRLFNFINNHGEHINNVFSYTNRDQNNNALTFVNNSYEQTDGYIHYSNIYPQIAETNIIDTLVPGDRPSDFIRFREHCAGLEYIRSITDLRKNGFHTQLNGYQVQIFWEFRLIQMDESPLYETAYQQLGDSGVEDLDSLIKQIRLTPMYNSFNDFLNRTVKMIHSQSVSKLGSLTKTGLEYLISQTNSMTGLNLSFIKIYQSLYPVLKNFDDKYVQIQNLDQEFKIQSSNITISIYSQIQRFYIFTCMMELIQEQTNQEQIHQELGSIHLQSHLNLKDIYLNLNQSLGIKRNIEKKNSFKTIIIEIFSNPNNSNYLGFNSYNDKTWFKKEPFIQLLQFVLITGVLDRKNTSKNWVQNIASLYRQFIRIEKFGAESNYQVDHFLELISNKN